MPKSDKSPHVRGCGEFAALVLVLFVVLVGVGVKALLDIDWQ